MEGEAREEKRRNQERHAAQRARIAFAMAVLICAAFCAVTAAPPTRYVQEGGVARATIRAPRDVLDPLATAAAQDAAAASVEPVYAYDEAQTQNLYDRVDQALAGLDRLRADADSLRRQIVAASARDSSLRLYDTGALTADEWEIVLSGEGVAQLMNGHGLLFSEDEIYHLLALSDTQYTLWLRELTVRLHSALRSGIPEAEAPAIQERFVSDMGALTPITVHSTLGKFAERFLQPTMFIDEAATERAVALARRNAAPVYIAAGETLVAQGDTIDAEAMALLNEAGYGLRWTTIALRWLACFASYATIGLLLYHFGRRFAAKTDDTPRSTAIMALLVAVDLLLSYVFLSISPMLNFAFLGVALVSQLCSVPAALIMSVLIAPAIGLMSGGRVSFDFFLVAQGMLSTLFGCLAGVGVTRCATKRSRLILGGFAFSLAATAIYALFASLVQTGSLAFFQSLLYAYVSGILAGIVCVGVMPLWELAFDVATPARLLELSDINHPLLHRLMLETPGTYNHSVLVGSLAESCANAIGANPMLARVGAYFHDVGKLKRPLFFSENQQGENPHDAIDAFTSAAIIIAHVRDGLDLARQYKLPKAVQSIIAEHHGNSLVAAFYAKALRESPDGKVDTELYRYEGPRPQSRESALVMICDSAEAAVRSLDNPSHEQTLDMIDKVLAQKFGDGQLRDCPLSFGDIEVVRAVIAQVFDGMHHDRVVYPDLEELKRAKSNGSP